MPLEVAALAGCAAGVAYAVWRGNQVGVLGLVALYAAIVGRIILTDLDLLMPALGLAIAMALVALVTVLCRDVSENVTWYNKKKRNAASNQQIE